MAKKLGATYRLGPELEVSGYGCEDHFFELDTVKHSWQTLRDILSQPELTRGMICDIGMPVHHKNTLYNCRVICLNQRILLIRPKLFLAAGNNYRESRWFTAWTRDGGRAIYIFGPEIESIVGQKTTQFGNAVIRTKDTSIACETCEELWVPKNPHVDYGLDGVEIIMNGSASHHELRKLHTRLGLITNASNRNGGVYVYANMKGCDGGRVYFDGSSMICMNGKIYAIEDQFTPDNVLVSIGVMDLDEVRSYRGGFNSRCVQSANTIPFPQIEICKVTDRPLNKEVKLNLLLPEQEISMGPPMWMWDYLRRSGARGFFLPLSGGADSASVAAMVASMSKMVLRSIQEGNVDALMDIRRIVKDDSFTPYRYQDIVSRIFSKTIIARIYLSTKNSGKETLDRAIRLANGIGAHHFNIGIDEAYDSIVNIFQKATGKTPQFEQNGGSMNEDLALQNIQARVRMLVPWTQDQKGFLLVLGTSNICESLRGYMTKYDCSSADINPIGGVNKSDLKRTLIYLSHELNLPVLAEIAGAKPTAELRPFIEGNTATQQLDEDEMGMTYDELDEFGKLRKISKSGPLSMFERLLFNWAHLTPRQVAEKVKRFFYFYSVNRHKMTVVTPSYHAEAYGTDDNRFDLRQFLYDTKWEVQFAQIDQIVLDYERENVRKQTTEPAPKL